MIREHIHLIDEKFRSDIRSRSLFMEIIRQPHGITRELRRMNSYGVLAAYLPAFNHIVGLMQYDLFHIYTVDEHILFVVRNLRRFVNPEYAHEFPLCHHVIGTLPKPNCSALPACSMILPRVAAATIPTWVVRMPVNFASDMISAIMIRSWSYGWSTSTC